MQKGRVGAKGELFPPKKIREKLHLDANTRVVYKVEDGRLIVEPVPSLEEVLREPSVIEITPEEFRRFRRELSRNAEP